jgi:hypothetical protein
MRGPIEEQPAPRGVGRSGVAAAWARQLLRLYPTAWRERYGAEVTAVLQQHRVSLWTVGDVLVGALDAHLHPNLLPGRLSSMPHGIRTSEIVIFCAFVLFCLAWVPLRLVRDPLGVWEAAVGVHPALLTTLTILDVAGLIATLAILAGGLPILLAALAQTLAARRWGVLLLFAVPLLAVLAIVVYWLVAAPASTARQSNAPNAALTPLAVVLQLGLLVLVLLAVGGSAAAIATGIGKSTLGVRLLRFALVPAAVATLAIAIGLVAGVALSALIFAEVPQVSSGLPLHVADALLMLAAAVLSGAALWRGLRAARGAGASA